MPHTTTIIVALAAISGFLVAAGGGFALGYAYAASAPARLIRRAGRDTQRCLSFATEATDLAARLCSAVSSATTTTENQISALLDGQKRLAEAVGKLLHRQTAINSEPTKIEWATTPLDRETELPNSEAFNANLIRLVNAVSDQPRGGILLVSLDGFERLKQRISKS